MLHHRIKEIIDTRVGIPEHVREALYDEIMREIEKSNSPVGRKENVTVMTEAGSLAADHQLKGGQVSKHDPKPKTI